MLTCGQLSYGGFIRELVYILSKSESQICTREGSFSRSLAEEDIVDTRCTYGMLAKEHVEYTIVISVECSMTDLISSS
ncbi:hypothetical protein T4E_2105 [Trichinella pseudospiralis]|uniref:Uncharacterized protein n=1 Tax=Trichinella pseudospiralis TaxID=6337 RepID=A0A0V0XFM0_TRIPS|nr:hypothetical protein T4E_2105 [Trichinella pseudospiralis]